jgi:hypothetical protein
VGKLACLRAQSVASAGRWAATDFEKVIFEKVIIFDLHKHMKKAPL